MMNPKNVNLAGIVGVGVIVVALGIHFIGAQQKAVQAEPNANSWLNFYGPPEGVPIPLDEANARVTRIKPLAPSASTSGTLSVGYGDTIRGRWYPDAHIGLQAAADGGA
jgi:hypothetical protein